MSKMSGIHVIAQEAIEAIDECYGFIDIADWIKRHHSELTDNEVILVRQAIDNHYDNLEY